ncbi:MAG: hypothetical protein AAF665_06385 [Pseudomonadota bacterium]
MRLALIAAAVASGLAGCATVVDETRTTAVLEEGFNGGTKYEIRRQLIQGPSGTYETTSVVYRGLTRGCIIDSPGDCESKARVLIDQVDESIFF